MHQVAKGLELQLQHQSGWLKTTEMYSVTVLESCSPKSRCQQCWFLLVVLGRVCFMPLSGLLGAARCTWCSLTCSVSLQSLLIFPWPSSLCVSMSTSQISSFLLEGHQSLDLVCVCVHPGIKPTSLMSPSLAGGSLPLAPPGNPHVTCELMLNGLKTLLIIKSYHLLSIYSVQNMY